MPADTDIRLKWTLTKNNCTQCSESIVTIRNYNAPIVNAGNDSRIEPGESAALHANITSNNTYTYQWSPATGLNDPLSKDPVANPVETTVYTLTATSDAGTCTNMDRVTVFVNNELKILNTITPNGDGFNDVWNIKNIYSYKKVNVAVMNRWGSQVYFSNGYAKPWDGTFNGKKVPAGIYYYVIDITDTRAKKSGSVTVIY